jgi:hypothetical protein
VGSRIYERHLVEQAARVDEGLDLFLEDCCAKNTSLDFSDAVDALYKRLRQEGKT